MRGRGGVKHSRNCRRIRRNASTSAPIVPTTYNAVPPLIHRLRAVPLPRWGRFFRAFLGRSLHTLTDGLKRTTSVAPIIVNCPLSIVNSDTNCQLSTKKNCQLSTKKNCQLSTVNCQLRRIVNCQLSIVNSFLCQPYHRQRCIILGGPRSTEQQGAGQVAGGDEGFFRGGGWVEGQAVGG